MIMEGITFSLGTVTTSRSSRDSFNIVRQSIFLPSASRWSTNLQRACDWYLKQSSRRPSQTLPHSQGTAPLLSEQTHRLSAVHACNICLCGARLVASLVQDQQAYVARLPIQYTPLLHGVPVVCHKCSYKSIPCLLSLLQGRRFLLLHLLVFDITDNAPPPVRVKSPRALLDDLPYHFIKNQNSPTRNLKWSPFG